MNVGEVVIGQAAPAQTAALLALVLRASGQAAAIFLLPLLALGLLTLMLVRAVGLDLS